MRIRPCVRERVRGEARVRGTNIRRHLYTRIREQSCVYVRISTRRT